jgi:hypothetical protein
VVVPKYFFAIQQTGKEEDDVHGIVLPNDMAALRHAERKILALRKQVEVRRDVEGAVIVRNEKHETVLCVPFLPACA